MADETANEAKEMAAAIMEVIRKIDPRYAEGGEFYEPPEGDLCRARVWDSGDKTKCGKRMPCPDHGGNGG